MQAADPFDHQEEWIRESPPLQSAHPTLLPTSQDGFTAAYAPGNSPMVDLPLRSPAEIIQPAILKDRLPVRRYMRPLQAVDDPNTVRTLRSLCIAVIASHDVNFAPRNE